MEINRVKLMEKKFKSMKKHVSKLLAIYTKILSDEGCNLSRDTQEEGLHPAEAE